MKLKMELSSVRLVFNEKGGHVDKHKKMFFQVALCAERAGHSGGDFSCGHNLTRKASHTWDGVRRFYRQVVWRENVSSVGRRFYRQVGNLMKLPYVAGG